MQRGKSFGRRLVGGDLPAAAAAATGSDKRGRFGETRPRVAVA